jgi:hypothetical protein
MAPPITPRGPVPADRRLGGEVIEPYVLGHEAVLVLGRRRRRHPANRGASDFPP